MEPAQELAWCLRENTSNVMYLAQINGWRKRGGKQRAQELFFYSLGTINVYTTK